MPTLIRLTIKQHRFEFSAMVLACLGLAIAALIEAARLNALNVPLSCLLGWQGPGVAPGGSLSAAAAHCSQLASAFLDLQDETDMGLVRELLLLGPVMAGILLGAPLVAAEIEQGTAPASWVHNSSRRRWVVAKLLSGAVVLVPLLLILGLAADVLEAAEMPTLDPHASFAGYLDRGVIDVFWGMAAFSGAIALGALFGRTLHAVIAALLVVFFVRATWDAGMTHFVLRPFAVRQAPQSTVPSYFTPDPDLHLYSRYYLDGQPFVGDVDAWYEEHQPSQTPEAGPTPTPGTNGQPPAGEIDGPVAVNFVIPGPSYWDVIGLISALLALGSLAAVGITVACVERRRPY